LQILRRALTLGKPYFGLDCAMPIDELERHQRCASKFLIAKARSMAPATRWVEKTLISGSRLSGCGRCQSIHQFQATCLLK
jgi:hypothetical protein